MSITTPYTEREIQRIITAARFRLPSANNNSIITLCSRSNREAACAQINQAYAYELITTKEEHEWRTDRALKARTMADLAELLHDIPKTPAYVSDALLHDSFSDSLMGFLANGGWILLDGGLILLALIPVAVLMLVYLVVTFLR